MAKKRMVNTNFWRDEYVEKLDPSEKLLFLYFITCPDTNLIGIYQIPLKIIAADTGFDKEMIMKILNRFKKDNKMIYVDGYIAIKNFMKHQNNNSPLIKKGIDRELKDIPQSLIEYIYDIDKVSISHIKLSPVKSSKVKSSIWVADAPPSLQDVESYVKESGYSVDPKTFYDYFTASGWVDAKGQKVYNWKQKLITWASHQHKKGKTQKTFDEIYERNKKLGKEIGID